MTNFILISKYSRPLMDISSEGEKIQKPLYIISGKFSTFILKFPTFCWIFWPQFRRIYIYLKSETFRKNFGWVQNQTGFSPSNALVQMHAAW